MQRGVRNITDLVGVDNESAGLSLSQNASTSISQLQIAGGWLEGIDFILARSNSASLSVLFSFARVPYLRPHRFSFAWLPPSSLPSLPFGSIVYGANHGEESALFFNYSEPHIR
jgi:hypothetical protein